MRIDRHMPKHKLVKDVLIKDFAESKNCRVGALLGRGGNADKKCQALLYKIYCI